MEKKQLAIVGHEGEPGHQGGPGLPRLLAALACAIGAELLSYFAPDTSTFKAIGMLVAAVAIGLAGWQVYYSGLVALRHGQLSISALMTVAVTGAFAIGQWAGSGDGDGAIRGRRADRGTFGRPGAQRDQGPHGARTRRGGDSGSGRLEERCRWGGSSRGDGPGSTGRTYSARRENRQGSSAVNQAPVTGESIPVDKEPGDQVYAGTINETGLLEVQVTATAQGSLLARIIETVETAQASKAPTERFVDRFAAIYTPAVFIAAVAVAILPPLLMSWTWQQAVYKALVLLVIGCPCALVISTPVTVVSGLAAAARRGILIKGGVHLEMARKIAAIALDKTGTITEGKPRLVAFEPLMGEEGRASAGSLAASLAKLSDHPVSKAIAAGLDHPTQEVAGFEALAGRGVQGQIGGKLYALGNHRLIEERGQCGAEFEKRLFEHESRGSTVTLLASAEAVLAIFAVADTIKESSRSAVADLLTMGVTPILLTGDNDQTAKFIGAEAGIADTRGNLLPNDKLAAIEALQQRHGPTAMTGDGINDAPALAKAELGISMGVTGTDTAMEAADIVLMNDDLRSIAEVIRLSRKTNRILRQNISLALLIKAVFLIGAFLGVATMWMAVFADMGASLLVVFNGLRLLSGSPMASSPATK